MLSVINCYSSLLIKFQNCQKNFVNSLSANSLSVEWLGFMLISSDIGSIIAESFICCTFCSPLVNFYSSFVILPNSELSDIVSLSWMLIWFSNAKFRLSKANSLEEYLVF